MVTYSEANKTQIRNRKVNDAINRASLATWVGVIKVFSKDKDTESCRTQEWKNKKAGEEEGGIERDGKSRKKIIRKKKKISIKETQEQLRQRTANMSRVAGRKLLDHTTETWADSSFHGAVSGIGWVCFF